MRKETSQAIAYALQMLSFLFLQHPVIPFVRKIYLFGSAARGELHKGSDIDIFIDCDESKEKDLESAAKKAVTNFYQSKDFEKWRLLRFTYPLKIHAGNLERWELKDSILADGSLLYAKEAGTPTAARLVLFTLKLPKKKDAYLRLSRLLFGRKEAHFQDTGLLAKFQGKKIGSQVFLLPAEHKMEIIDFLNKQKIDYRMKEIGLL